MRRALACAAGVVSLGIGAPAVAPDPAPTDLIVPRVASPAVELALAAPAPAIPAAPPDAPPDAAPPAAGRPARVVVSTGYCLRGTTASGRQVGHGQVAMNGVPLGSSWHVLSGPLAGRTLVATDRIGHGSDFDIWFPSCAEARAYGRRTIRVSPA
jgi:3D (Asp-Asp-Asp) domain-containing protein